jgi:hypothetical protein
MMPLKSKRALTYQHVQRNQRNSSTMVKSMAAPTAIGGMPLDEDCVGGEDRNSSTCANSAYNDIGGHRWSGEQYSHREGRVPIACPTHHCLC